MSAKQSLDALLGSMPEERINEILEFAAYLNWRAEREEWRRFGQSQLAHAYGPDEPEYSLADVKQESHS